MTRATLTAALLAACATTRAPPSPNAAGASVEAPPSDCPERPAIELYAEAPEGPLEPLHVGGHITALDAARDEDGTLSLVGTLDVKGTLAFERGTRELALANYAATQQSAPPRRLTLALHGRPVASMAVSSALRGRRFRIAVLTGLTPPFSDDTRDELDAALRIDRRCFPGR